MTTTFSKLAICTVLALTFSLGVAGAEDLVIDGSTTVGPIAKAFAEFYMKNNKDMNITVSESGSGNGAKGLINGTCQVGCMSRFMKDKEYKAAVETGVMPVAHVIAMDGIAMSVHPSNPVKNLTTAQVKDIYVGNITNWQQVGGPNLNIIMISRDTNSGTFETFAKLVMNKEKVVDSAEVVGSNGQMRQRIQKTPSAIGYLGLGFVDRTVKPLDIDGVKPSNRTIASGVYPIARPLYMFTNGYPKLGSHLHRFVTLYLSPKGQEIVSAIGFVPVTEY